MSQFEAIKCDKCKTVFEKFNGKSFLMLNARTVPHCETETGTIYDLCSECTKGFIMFMNNELMPIPPERRGGPRDR